MLLAKLQIRHAVFRFWHPSSAGAARTWVLAILSHVRTSCRRVERHTSSQSYCKRTEASTCANGSLTWRCSLAQPSADKSKGRTLRFLANVDPVDVARALNGLDPETTMAVVVSKTFTTAETMLNARTVR